MNLAVGTDVQILSAVGVLDGAGQAVVPVTPPFPARDRFYVQAVFSSNGFVSITPSNGVVLINYQDASLTMPIGGLVSSTGNLLSGTPGVTVTRTGVGAYTITHTSIHQRRGADHHAHHRESDDRQPPDDVEQHDGDLQRRRDVLLRDPADPPLTGGGADAFGRLWDRTLPTLRPYAWRPRRWRLPSRPDRLQAATAGQRPNRVVGLRSCR